ncbi:NAD(P)-binding protein [Hypoxylon fragiforme]|uniref:NAD(P)-binding protein n=1 Tax=Hypoxylon fragiforme TaxID=63214 RepID=UPI0020C5BF56|nr:NAD(P)-binding protein [Hypoxylon fragiforme]KAI2612603.1 NAD(P)-binding protein [Hypoxylon fragiforme]
MSYGSAYFQAVTHLTETIYHDTYEFISPKKLNLRGTSVFITGASKGIGRETALSFAVAGCAKIGLGARSDLSKLEAEVKEAAKKAGHKEEPKVVKVKLDVASQESVKAAAETVSKEFGGKEVNVKGVFLCSKYFMPLVLAGEVKTNIIVSSIGAIDTQFGASSYQSTKFAVCRMAEFIAVEYHDKGLVCFAVHPGGLKTELAVGMPPELHHYLVDELPLPGHCITWLGSANRPWLNGRFVSVNWDMKELEAKKDEIVEGDLLKFRLITAV